LLDEEAQEKSNEQIPDLMRLHNDTSNTKSIRMKTLKFTLLLSTLAVLVGIIGCKKDEEGDDQNTGNAVIEINTNLELPQGAYLVDPDTMEVDATVTVATSSGTMPINPGAQINGQIEFTAPNGNVVAAGMRFGDSGPVSVVPITGALGQTSGTLSMPFSIDASVCNDLSSICHDIKCYEFAITAAGEISQANIRDVALMCGNCDEPSCVDLIEPPCGGGGGGTGTGSFTSDIGSGQNMEAFIGVVTDPTDPFVTMEMDNDTWGIGIDGYTTTQTTGTVTFTPDCIDEDCWSLSLYRYVEPYIYPYSSVSGTGTWTANGFDFNVLAVDDGEDTISISGSINAPINYE